MFQITEKDTPVLYALPQSVRDKAMEFNQLYTGQNSVAVRAGWGKLLEQINKAIQSGVTVNGKTLDGKATFRAVCRELGISPSTAYGYINSFISSNNFPPEIQQAAADAGLNLALDWVPGAYTALNVEQAKLSEPNYVRGVIARLEDVRPAKGGKAKKSVEQRLIEKFADIFEFTMDEEVSSGLIRYCMGQAAKESLNSAGLETWQALVHQLATDERASQDSARQVADETAR